MKQKVNHNGHCLYCGKESKAPFCNRQCYRDYVKVLPDKEYEKQQRDSLSDRVVKRSIYIGGKGKIKYNQITPEMIIEKRAQILTWRARKQTTHPVRTKAVKRCKICSKDLTKGRSVYCSDECEREQRRIDSFKRDSSKKLLRERICNECGKVFIPEYGNKRSVYCCDDCLHTHMHRIRRQKERARLKKANIESVDAIKVFKRDGWKCQLCHKKLKRKDRGTYQDNAPELDHIIPLSKGGEHSYRNTQCACRKCNSEKSNNELGQLRLFG